MMDPKRQLEWELLQVGRLNGNTVVEREAHETCVTIMVLLRGNMTTPYVVATWWPDLKTSWMWGHYCADIREADLTFKEVAKRNAERRSL